MNSYDVAIIGAGPAGMMAAITAAKAGQRVLLLDKNEQLGRKILATGNGRCNLTNLKTTVEHYHGAPSYFIRDVLNQFDQHQTIAFFEAEGVALKEEDRGRIFPRSNQASTIVAALEHLLIENRVTVQTECTVSSITKEKNFIIKTNAGKHYEAAKLVLATGGKASFKLGSSGDGLYWASKLGHNIIPVFAALVPLETTETWVQKAQGIKVEAKATSTVAGKIIKETTGDVLFTHFGLSGHAIMAHAGGLSPHLEKTSAKITLDLYPEATAAELDQRLTQIFTKSTKKNLKNSLSGLFPVNLVPILIELAKLDPAKNVSEISKAERQALVQTIKALSLTVKKVRPLKEAQVSRGGVDTTEVGSKTLQSKIVPGLYFAGEILDVDADSGGFNLQWAWASGFVAGSLK